MSEEQFGDMWDAATRDLDAEADARAYTQARIETANFWPFLARSESPEDYENRKALVVSKIAGKIEDPQLRDRVLAAWDEDYAIIHPKTAAPANVWAMGIKPGTELKVNGWGANAWLQDGDLVYVLSGDDTVHQFQSSDDIEIRSQPDDEEGIEFYGPYKEDDWKLGAKTAGVTCPACGSPRQERHHLNAEGRQGYTCKKCQLAWDMPKTALRETKCPKCGSQAVTYSKAKIYDGNANKCSSCGNKFNTDSDKESKTADFDDHTYVTTNDGAVLDVHHSRFGGNYVATCETCGMVIALWDDEEELKSHVCDPQDVANRTQGSAKTAGEGDDSTKPAMDGTGVDKTTDPNAGGSVGQSTDSETPPPDEGLSTLEALLSPLAREADGENPTDLGDTEAWPPLSPVKPLLKDEDVPEVGESQEGGFGDPVEPAGAKFASSDAARSLWAMDDHEDLYGTAMAHAFGIAEALNETGNDVPASWEYKPGIGSGAREEWPDNQYIEMLESGEVTPQELIDLYESEIKPDIERAKAEGREYSKKTAQEDAPKPADFVGKEVEIYYRARDIGYGEEEGEFWGRITGETDSWGKWTVVGDRVDAGKTLYLFEDEFVDIELADQQSLFGSKKISANDPDYHKIMQDNRNDTANKPSKRPPSMPTPHDTRCGKCGRLITPGSKAGSCPSCGSRVPKAASKLAAELMDEGQDEEEEGQKKYPEVSKDAPQNDLLPKGGKTASEEWDNADTSIPPGRATGVCHWCGEDLVDGGPEAGAPPGVVDWVAGWHGTKYSGDYGCSDSPINDEEGTGPHETDEDVARIMAKFPGRDEKAAEYLYHGVIPGVADGGTFSKKHDASFLCNECGRKFSHKLAADTYEIACPGCGGFDTDLHFEADGNPFTPENNPMGSGGGQAPGEIPGATNQNPMDQGMDTQTPGAPAEVKTPQTTRPRGGETDMTQPGGGAQPGDGVTQGFASPRSA